MIYYFSEHYMSEKYSCYDTCQWLTLVFLFELYLILKMKNILEALRNIELTVIIMRKMKIIIYRTILKCFAKKYGK